MKFLLITFLLLSCATIDLQHPLIIQTGPCFGQCPQYRIEIRPDGQYFFTNTKTGEDRKGFLSKEEKQALQQLLTVIDTLTLAPSYGLEMARDLPKIDIHYNNQPLHIYGRSAAPQALQNLLQWTDQWYYSDAPNEIK